MKYHFYIGSFDNAFHICEWDSEIEKLVLLDSFAHLKPAQFALSKDHKRLYITSEMYDCAGKVASFDVEDPSHPRLINSVQSGSKGPCYISLSRQEDFLVGCSYFEGQIEVYPVEKSGVIRDRCFLFQSEETGTGYVSGSFGQAMPRLHMSYLIPESRIFLFSDYSGDAVISFEQNADGSLSMLDRAAVSKGDAPRWFVGNPTNPSICYMITEFTSRVYSLQIGQEGKIRIMDCLSLSDINHAELSSSIRISPDGRFLYIPNRLSETISVVAAGEDDRRLQYVGAVYDVGYVRDALPTKDGAYLIYGNVNDGTVSMLRRNTNNGMCSPCGNVIDVPTPVYFQEF